MDPISSNISSTLVLAIPTKGNYESQISGIKEKIASLPDGPEKTYYELALKEAEEALATEKANQNLTPQALNEKILEATQSIRNEMKELQDSNPDGWKWSIPSNGAYIMTPIHEFKFQ